MGNVRKFYLQEDRKDIQTFEFIGSESQQYDDDIEVIESQPVLEELKAVRDGLAWAEDQITWDGNPAEDALTRLDTLIKQIEGESDG